MGEGIIFLSDFFMVCVGGGGGVQPDGVPAVSVWGLNYFFGGMVSF